MRSNVSPSSAANTYFNAISLSLLLSPLPESSRGPEGGQAKRCKPASLGQAFPGGVPEAAVRCRVVETDSSGPEMSYPDEEGSEDGGGSDAEGPPSKRIKLEFPPDSPPRKGTEAAPASSEESDSDRSPEPGLLPPQRAPLARKANGCKAGRRKGPGPSPSCPCTSEFASVIQTQRSSALQASAALGIKSEQGPSAKGAPWTCPPAHKGGPFTVSKALSLERPPARPAPPHLFVSIPDAVLTPPELDGGTAKAPFGASPRAAPATAPPSADTLSPPLSGSPCEERAASTPFTPLVCPAEVEVLQRFHAGNVVLPLMPHPHASATGPQGLYATSTIRYAPAEVTLAMQSNVLPPAHPLGLAEAKTPRELMYHHLQRLNMVAPFGSSAGLAQLSGGAFAAADSLFSTLPFSVAGGGLHGPSALERKED